MIAILPPRIIATVVALLFSISLVLAEDKDDKSDSKRGSDGEPFAIGVFLGPSVPSESVERVYGNLDLNDVVNAYDVASTLGYHLGAKFRFGLSDMFSASGGVSFVQFPAQTLNARLESGVNLELKTVTTYVPVCAGITFIPLQGLIRPYLGVELMYAYRSVTLSQGNKTFEEMIVGTGQDVEPKTSQLGAAGAFGLELNLGGLRPFIELKYNITNAFTRGSSEETRGFVNVSLGLVF